MLVSHTAHRLSSPSVAQRPELPCFDRRSESLVGSHLEDGFRRSLRGRPTNARFDPPRSRPNGLMSAFLKLSLICSMDGALYAPVNPLQSPATPKNFVLWNFFCCSWVLAEVRARLTTSRLGRNHKFRHARCESRTRAYEFLLQWVRSYLVFVQRLNEASLLLLWLGLTSLI
jgi:hypothetical protein